MGRNPINNGLKDHLEIWAENQEKFADVIEQLKQEFGLVEFRPYLGPDATPETVLEVGRKMLTAIMNGDFESEPPIWPETGVEKTELN